MTTQKLKRSVKRLINGLIYERNECFWYCRELAGDIPRVVPDLTVEVTLRDPDTTVAWLRTFDEPWMSNEKEIRVGLAGSHYFANVQFMGKIIAYSKVAHTRAYIGDYSTVLRFPAGFSLLHHIYVLREYRKHNIAKLLMCALLEELKAAGYARMCCQIAVWNEPSMRLFASVGFQRVAHVRFFKFFGILRLWQVRREGEFRFTLTRDFSVGSLLDGCERRPCGVD